MKKSLSFIACCIIPAAMYAQTDWHIAGNAGTKSGTNFIGTTDKTAFNIRTNNAVRLSITSSGNVGIGTKTPASKLDVAGTITGLDSYFGYRFPVSAGTSGASYSSVGYGLTFTDTTANYRYRLNDFSSMISFRSGGFDFNTAPFGTAGAPIPYTIAMAILQNGNVGIGTLQPADKLHVAASTTHDTPVALIENTGLTNLSDGVFIKAGSSTAAGNYFVAFKKPDGAQIGQIVHSPFNGVLYSTSSDKRLKDIIGASQKGLADLMKIIIYDYTFKSDPQKEVQTGFMAQELYDIFPQAVSKPRDNNEPAEKNPWMVDYGRLTPLIIKAVQELSGQNEKLKRQNNDLEKKYEAQQKEIDELKAMLISQNRQNIIDPKQTASN
ncbi:hypothetical protein FRZ67_04640 [Panacibacter ginsenosidivorans]|uniref:Peptidase S74 domain-containing protein n=1 Tax=Panacibacter ginsenosidivorans TaxID=1813871 RepID=A0A5B8V5Y0_9BACT|nr:tail fiber domain-containing protein [Panacibacter ginsenosidivorans]QEC66619.1 hypothetical protein FRZ67_04640 [Panacibacter ginsenosidivorans]